VLLCPHLVIIITPGSTSNREIIGLPQGLYAGSSTLVMHTAARARRKAHGTLM
jgi:hypothetical protein